MSRGTTPGTTTTSETTLDPTASATTMDLPEAAAASSEVTGYRPPILEILDDLGRGGEQIPTLNLLKERAEVGTGALFNGHEAYIADVLNRYSESVHASLQDQDLLNTVDVIRDTVAALASSNQTLRIELSKKSEFISMMGVGYDIGRARSATPEAEFVEDEAPSPLPDPLPARAAAAAAPAGSKYELKTLLSDLKKANKASSIKALEALCNGSYTDYAGIADAIVRYLEDHFQERRGVDPENWPCVVDEEIMERILFLTGKSPEIKKHILELDNNILASMEAEPAQQKAYRPSMRAGAAAADATPSGAASSASYESLQAQQADRVEGHGQ